MKKAAMLALVGGMTVMTGVGQSELSAWTASGRGVATTFVTDYQAIGINPSNLGWTAKYEEKKVTLGFLEGSYSLYSEALSKPEVKETFIQFGSGSDDLTYAQKVSAAKDFTESGFAINLDFQPIGIALTTENAGGFAAGVRDRVRWYSQLNETTSEILFLGYNAPYFDRTFFTNATDTIATTNPDSINYANTNVPKTFSEILDGSKLTLTWTREYSFSYGVRLADMGGAQLYGGVGFKYLQGIALMDIRSENGSLTAHSALAPGFGVDYGGAPSTNPSGIPDSTGFTNVGSGFGMDFGLSIIINDNWKIGASITDVGTMNWDGNVYEAQDTIVYGTDNEGLNSLNIFTEIGDFAGDDGFFKWKGLKEIKTKLPTLFRFGTSYRFFDGKLELGADIVLPLNDEAGNLENALIAFGGDVKPMNWLRISAGVSTGGNYGFNMPVGLTIALPSGTWEAGIASRDALTFFTSDSPTLSLATGLLRFRF